MDQSIFFHGGDPEWLITDGSPRSSMYDADGAAYLFSPWIAPVTWEGSIAGDGSTWIGSDQWPGSDQWTRSDQWLGSNQWREGNQSVRPKPAQAIVAPRLLPHFPQTTLQLPELAPARTDALSLYPGLDASGAASFFIPSVQSVTLEGPLAWDESISPETHQRPEGKQWPGVDQMVWPECSQGIDPSLEAAPNLPQTTSQLPQLPETPLHIVNMQTAMAEKPGLRGMNTG